MVRRLAVLALVLACAPAPDRAAALEVFPERATTRSSELAFRYSASDGEFSVDLDLRTDGRWSRSEHSGALPPSGKLSRSATRQFLKFLASAPFSERYEPCEAPRRGRARYEDFLRGRVSRSESAFIEGRGWTPCGAVTDARTRRLVACLEAMIDGAPTRDLCDASR